jgi:hypothetical protein
MVLHPFYHGHRFILPLLLLASPPIATAGPVTPTNHKARDSGTGAEALQRLHHKPVATTTLTATSSGKWQIVTLTYESVRKVTSDGEAATKTAEKDGSREETAQQRFSGSSIQHQHGDSW